MGDSRWTSDNWRRFCDLDPCPAPCREFKALKRRGVSAEAVTYLRQGVFHHIARVSHDCRWKLAPTIITQRPRRYVSLRLPAAALSLLISLSCYLALLLLAPPFPRPTCARVLFLSVSLSLSLSLLGPSSLSVVLPSRAVVCSFSLSLSCQEERLERSAEISYASTRRHNDKCSPAAAASKRNSSVTSRARHFFHR